MGRREPDTGGRHDIRALEVLSDETLILAVGAHVEDLERAKACGEVLIRRHQKSLRNFVARRRPPQRVDVDDIVHEVFRKVWQGASQYNPQRQAKFSTWMYAIAVNYLHDLRRLKEHRQTRIGAEASAGDVANTHECLRVDGRRLDDQLAIRRALELLDADDYAVLHLHYIAGLTQREAASVLRVSIQNVQARLRSAKDGLRKTLEEWIPESSGAPK